MLFCSACNLFAPTETEPPPDLGSDVTSMQDVATTMEDAGGRNPGGDLGPPDVGTQDAGPDPSDMARVRDIGPDQTSMDLGADPDLAGPGDVGMDMASADPCAWPDTIFCSGYEDPTFGDWSGVESDMVGVLHSTNMVHSGAGAMQLDLIASEGWGGTWVDLTPPIAPTNDEVWTRFYMYWPSDDPIEAIEFSGLWNDDEGLNTLLADTYLNLHTHLDPGTTVHEVLYAIPQDQWVCVEWHVVTGAGTGEVLVAIDGTTRIDVRALDIQPMAAWNRFELGIVWSDDAQDPMTIYFDDVFVGRSRAGCLP